MWQRAVLDRRCLTSYHILEASLRGVKDRMREISMLRGIDDDQAPWTLVPPREHLSSQIASPRKYKSGPPKYDYPPAGYVDLGDDEVFVEESGHVLLHPSSFQQHHQHQHHRHSQHQQQPQQQQPHSHAAAFAHHYPPFDPRYGPSTPQFARRMVGPPPSQPENTTDVTLSSQRRTAMAAAAAAATITTPPQAQTRPTTKPRPPPPPPEGKRKRGRPQKYFSDDERKKSLKQKYEESKRIKNMRDPREIKSWIQRANELTKQYLSALTEATDAVLRNNREALAVNPTRPLLDVAYVTMFEQFMNAYAHRHRQHHPPPQSSITTMTTNLASSSSPSKPHDYGLPKKKRGRPPKTAPPVSQQFTGMQPSSSLPAPTQQYHPAGLHSFAQTIPHSGAATSVGVVVAKKNHQPPQKRRRILPGGDDELDSAPLVPLATTLQQQQHRHQSIGYSKPRETDFGGDGKEDDEADQVVDGNDGNDENNNKSDNYRVGDHDAAHSGFIVPPNVEGSAHEGLLPEHTMLTHPSPSSSSTVFNTSNVRPKGKRHSGGVKNNQMLAQMAIAAATADVAKAHKTSNGGASSSSSSSSSSSASLSTSSATRVSKTSAPRKNIIASASGETWNAQSFNLRQVR